MTTITEKPSNEGGPRSRRALLVGALGGLGAWAASALARATPVHAGTDGDVILGASNISPTFTYVETTGLGPALEGRGDEVIGIQGDSRFGVGLYGQSENYTGVIGFAGPEDSLAIFRPKTGVYGFAGRDNASTGVRGESPGGHGVHGKSTTGFGGYFEGPVLSTKFYELLEIGTPATPIANHARLFVKDNGLGKTQLCVKFANGTIKVLATEG